MTTTAAAGTTTALYGYDAVSRLTSECYPTTGTSCTSTAPYTTYTYDKVGNRKTQAARTTTGTKTSTVSTAYTYDAAHELLTQKVGAVASVTNTWTPNGALATSTTPAGTTTYTTDLTDELISAALPNGSTVSYTQDTKGNRTSRVVGGVTNSTWAWDELSSLPVRTGEYDQTGSLATAWLTDQTSSTGAALAETSGALSSWLLNDPFANVTAVIGTSGASLSGTRSLNAFGATRTGATGTLATSAIGFAGQYLEAATGLYDMRARDYDPTSGRFTANDPVAVPTGMPYIAGYSYAYNNPLMHSDASGLCVGMKGTPQDRACTYTDYYWGGLPGAMGDAFMGAYAGASEGVTFNTSMLVDDTSYKEYSGTSSYWIGDVVGVACSALTIGVAGVGSWASKANGSTAATGGSGPVLVGQAGEAAVRAVYNIGPKATRLIGGNTRIFDGLNNYAVSEVKNVAYQALTQQLKDSIAYAKLNTLRFDLYVRGGTSKTKLSGPLEDAIRNGDVNLRYIP